MSRLNVYLSHSISFFKRDHLRSSAGINGQVKKKNMNSKHSLNSMLF